MLICITGLSGVGKTTILNELKNEYKIAILDTLVHEHYCVNDRGYDIIKNNFGIEYVNENGVDRKKLGQLVFSDAEQMDKLNLLLEPLIIDIIEKLKKQAINEIVLVEAAALLTNYDRYSRFFDKIILIQAPHDRVMQNTKNKFFYLDKFENFVWELNSKMKFDLVVDNNESPKNAVTKISNFLAKILTKK